MGSSSGTVLPLQDLDNMARWSSKIPQLVSTCKSGEQGGIHASKTKHGSRKLALMRGL